MIRVDRFLQCVGLAVCDKATPALSGHWPFADALPEVARTAFEHLRRELVTDDLQFALRTVASADPADFADALARALDRLADARALPYRDALGEYLGLIPQTAHQILRRPDDPSGQSLPAGFAVSQPDDLIAFLPPRRPRFHPAGGPPGLDGWELGDLVGMGECGEVWMAFDDDQPDNSPSAIKFATDPAAGTAVLANADLFLQVFELNGEPGIVPLRSVYLETDPPALESAFVYGYDLTALIHEWKWRFDAAKPEASIKIVRRLAEIVGKAHARGVVHRDLKPSNVLLHPGDAGKFTVWVTDFGWGQIAAARSADMAQSSTDRPEQARLTTRGAYTPIYEAPQVAQGDAPDPRDDVYSLGMIWYQLLRRDVRASAPSGTDWAEDLTADGLTEAQARLLGACLATRPDRRPADANVLVQSLTQALLAKQPATADDGSRLISLKSQSGYVPPVKPDTPPVYTGPSAGRAGAVSSGFLTGMGTVKMGQSLGTKEESTRLTPSSSASAVHGPGSTLKSVRNVVGMSFAVIPAGTFTMGSPDDESGRREHEGPAHEVTLTRPYFISAYPVTQAQFEKVMGKNPAHFSRSLGGPDYPVESVSWYDAERFCETLSLVPAEEAAGRSYRLPTEAEWEYACRAGTTTAYPFGDEIGPAVAHFSPTGGGTSWGTHKGQTVLVGQSPANPWWVYETIGNVAEWVSDWYDEYYYFDSPAEDPHGPTGGTLKVTRGGSWMSPATDCRSASRRPHDPGSPVNFVGFRVVMVPQPPGGTRAGATTKRDAGPNWLG